MDNLKRIEPTEKGINLFFETYGIFIPYDVEEPTWDKAKEIAAERGHTMPSVDQGLAVIENKAEITKALTEAGKPIFDDWFWLDREFTTNISRAWAVFMDFGRVGWHGKYSSGYVRAVSAFQL